MIREFRDRLKQRTAERERAIGDKLAGGHAKDYAAYREQVGRAKEAQEMRDIIEQVFRECMTDDDD